MILRYSFAFSQSDTIPDWASGQNGRICQSSVPQAPTFNHCSKYVSMVSLLLILSLLRCLHMHFLTLITIHRSFGSPYDISPFLSVLHFKSFKTFFYTNIMNDISIKGKLYQPSLKKIFGCSPYGRNSCFPSD